jgi:cobalt-zinc-cadmium efflux system outer membrane protein
MHRVAIWPCRPALAALALALSTPAPALADGVPAGPLSLAEATAVVGQHPILAGRRAGVEAARSKAEFASFTTPWEVTGELMNFGILGEPDGFAIPDPVARGLDVVEITVGIGRTIETGGKPGARRRVADVETQLAEAALAADMWALRAGAAKGYWDAVAARQRLVLAREAAAAAAEFIATADRRVQAGAASAAEAEAARAIAARRSVEVLAAESGVAAADSAFGAALGAEGPREPAPARLPDPRPDRDLPADLAIRIDRSPELVAARLGVTLGEATVAAAELQARPDVRVGAGVRFLNEFDATAFMANVSVPIGTAQRAAPLAAAARADRAVAAATAERARQLLAARVRGLELDARTAAARFATVDGEILPRSRTATELLERGYALGRFSWVEVSAARQAVIDAEAERIAAALAYRDALVALEALLGPFDPTVPDAPAQAAAGSEAASRP